MTDNTNYLAKQDLLLAVSTILTVMTWFTVWNGLPLDEASAGPASWAFGSEMRDPFKKQCRRKTFLYSVSVENSQLLFSLAENGGRKRRKTH